MHTLYQKHDHKFSVKCFKCLWHRLFKHKALNELKYTFLDYLILRNLYLEHYFGAVFGDVPCQPNLKIVPALRNRVSCGTLEMDVGPS